MRELRGLLVGDPPEVWRSLGFAVDDGAVVVSGVSLRLGHDQPGLSGWELGDGSGGPPTPEHPNGVTGIDHVVLMATNLDAAIDALSAEGHDLRRIREAGNGVRQAFFRLGPVILEVVGPVDSDGLWGITFTVRDIDATAAFLGDRLGAVKDAVQPGRRIATLAHSAGSTVPIAFISKSGAGSRRAGSPPARVPTCGPLPTHHPSPERRRNRPSADAETS